MADWSSMSLSEEDNTHPLENEDTQLFQFGELAEGISGLDLNGTSGLNPTKVGQWT